MRNPMQKKVINPNDFVTRSGTRKKKVRSPVYDGRKLSLATTGEIDTQNEIDSHALECDMSYIMSRLRQGDVSVLSSKSPMFADFRQLPTNFREVLDVALSAERTFNSLPLDVRAQFGNDYRRFIAESGTDYWNRVMNFDQSDHQDPVPEVVQDA